MMGDARIKEGGLSDECGGLEDGCTEASDGQLGFEIYWREIAVRVFFSSVLWCAKSGAVCDVYERTHFSPHHLKITFALHSLLNF
jgi:hypothetical protein